MNEKQLIEYYNKFNEDKRLNSRHGKVEFITTMKYIDKYLSKFNNPKILDVGAGCGRYSITLANKGYDVTAVELVKHNLRVIEKKSDKVKVFQGNAIDLSRFNDKSFDLILLFGPMYHLIDDNDKIKALKEAKRLLTDNGIIMVAYIMNEYCVLTYGFKENHILDCIKNNELDDKYHCIRKEIDLYSPVRLEDIDKFNKEANLKRIQIITPDGPANYIRPYLNKLDEESFNKFIEYHLTICERYDILGASAHTVDILKKENN